MGTKVIDCRIFLILEIVDMCVFSMVEVLAKIARYIFFSSEIANALCMMGFYLKMNCNFAMALSETNSCWIEERVCIE